MTLLEKLKTLLKGEVYDDYTVRHLYATDASAYREVPMAVAFPKDAGDLQVLVKWADQNGVPLIPRAAGTSLAGQVVGSGLVVDTGRYMNRILTVDPEARTVWVEPGVIRDDLNKALKPYGFHFAPETSTSNRCMLGGMAGNNACGAHSLIYGSTRDHLLEVKGFLADGSPFHTLPLSGDALADKLTQPDREGEVYRYLTNLLNDKEVRDTLVENSPWPEIRRRNTGYALDMVMQQAPWNTDGKPLNLSTLIAGSEGTLMMISSLKLSLVPLPPPVTVLLCPHFSDLTEAFHGNLVALQHPVTSIELVDNVILDCTAGHQGLRANRFFIKGDPRAVLFIELSGDNLETLLAEAQALAGDLATNGLGYHYPVVTGADIGKVWELRKAGLGLLSNVEGPAKPVPVIEDTAVRPADLPAYMVDFQSMLEEYGLSCVYYAHISTGELHLRPVLDLKNPADRVLFRTVATRTAALVKKYRGSLSGEHGDGRLRGEFIPFMVGDKVYQWFVELKHVFDPAGILNPGKITGAPPMDTSLRYSKDYREPHFYPMFRYGPGESFLQAVERCNGSGDCRRPFGYEGLMCPSYQASLDERLSTRGRANLIRETVSQSPDKPFANPALREILDQCLACKGCKSDCPSSVDMARYKAEVMHQFYKHHATPLHVSLVARIYSLYSLAARFPGVFNAFSALPLVAAFLKKVSHIHPARELPKLSNPTFSTWYRKYLHKNHPSDVTAKGTLVLFVDEFTQLFDAHIGIKAYELLTRLGYKVIPYYAGESGRAAFSKGKLTHARFCAEKNVMKLKGLIQENIPLVGTEPSALLAFRDEYPDIVREHFISDAQHIADHTLLIEEFLVQEFECGRISSNQFSDDEMEIVFHGHCHQKTLSRNGALKKMLEIPSGFKATEIISGCCGMAGSFGMEKQNYELSMKIGEMILFPYIRRLLDGTKVAMAGTSCRQQVFDGTGKRAEHPVEILHKALQTS